MFFSKARRLLRRNFNRLHSMLIRPRCTGPHVQLFLLLGTSSYTRYTTYRYLLSLLLLILLLLLLYIIYIIQLIFMKHTSEHFPQQCAQSIASVQVSSPQTSSNLEILRVASSLRCPKGCGLILCVTVVQSPR